MTDDAGDGVRGVRARYQPMLVDVLHTSYGLTLTEPPVDMGGSSNLNLRLQAAGGSYVARVYRPYVTADRLTDIQAARRVVGAAGIPVAAAVPTGDGAGFVTVDGRLLEVEAYVPHDGYLNSAVRLHRTLPLLGRIHTALAALDLSHDGADPPFVNHVSTGDLSAWTGRGAARIRSWDATADEQRLADASEELAADLGAAEERLLAPLPEQAVHGDFWDDNVLVRGEEVVAVTDFDFLGRRRRIDDLALTLYFAVSTPQFDLADNVAGVRRLVDAYDSGLDQPLTFHERAALPLALARQPLWGIGRWVALLDDEEAARRHAVGVATKVLQARAILDRLDDWRNALGADV